MIGLKSKVFRCQKKWLSRPIAWSFFGEKLSKCPEFLQAALDYPEDLLFTAEMIRLLPKSAAPVLAPLLMRQHQASKILVSYLMPMVEERLKGDPMTDKTSTTKPIDVIQIFIKADARKNAWTAQKIVQVVLGIWFAAVHQPAMSLVYALSDICQHPEYKDALEKELGNCSTDGKHLDGMPLLDGFLKESARLCPSDSISCLERFFAHTLLEMAPSWIQVTWPAFLCSLSYSILNFIPTHQRLIRTASSTRKTCANRQDLQIQTHSFLYGVLGNMHGKFKHLWKAQILFQDRN